MRNIRFGKDITTRWRVRTNGENVSLENRDLHLFLTDQFGNKTELPFVVEDTNLVSFMWWGKDHKRYGNHIVTLFENLGEEGQTCVDAVDYVNIVEYTTQENDATSDNLTFETVDLEGDLTTTGRGLNNYELWILAGHEGTLEDFLEWSKGEQGDPGEDGKSLTFDDLTEEQKEQLRGLKGDPGADAKINGVNILRIVQGSNMSITQSGNTMTFSAVMNEASILYSQLAYNVQGMILNGQMAYNAVGEKYTKPSSGIPEKDLSADVRKKLDNTFVAVFDSTPLADVQEAFDAEKNIIAVDPSAGEDYYSLLGMYDGEFYFVQIDPEADVLYTLTLGENGWSFKDIEIRGGGGESYDDTELRERIEDIEGKESTWNAKQNALVSGTNIKTVNGKSLLGSGNIEIHEGGESYDDTELRQLIGQKASQQQVDTLSQNMLSLNNALNDKASTSSVNDLADEVSGKQDSISDLAAIRSGASKGATAVQPSAIADMATKTYVDGIVGDINEVLTEIVG